VAQFQTLKVILARGSAEVGFPTTQTVRVVIPREGPQGPQGPPGEQGPQGPPGSGGGASSWDELSGKPSAFPPSAHAESHADGGADSFADNDLVCRSLGAEEVVAAAELQAKDGDYVAIFKPPATPPAGAVTLTTPATSGTLALAGSAPTAHAASHAANGSDPLTPSAIGAMSLFDVASATYSTDQTLPAVRAREFVVSTSNSDGITLTLPVASEGALPGDVYIIIGGSGMAGAVTVRRVSNLSPLIYATLATITTTGQRFRFRANTGATANWAAVPVDTHTHPTADITGLGTAATSAATDFLPSTAPTTASLTTNGQFAVEATSDTLLTLKYRGSDGVTRSVAFPIS
jgi:hypothetical protein